MDLYRRNFLHKSQNSESRLVESHMHIINFNFITRAIYCRAKLERKLKNAIYLRGLFGKTRN